MATIVGIPYVDAAMNFQALSNAKLFAPHITAFLQERLPLQRAASEYTCDSYAYTFQLMFQFAAERLHVTPSALYIEQLDASLLIEFLQYLETKRGNSPRMRNARLAAIKSFMRFMEHRVPALLEQSRILYSEI